MAWISPSKTREGPREWRKLRKLDAQLDATAGYAFLASQSQREMTLWQALQDNWKAAMWSAVISLTIIMEGYDVGKQIAPAAE